MEGCVESPDTGESPADNDSGSIPRGIEPETFSGVIEDFVCQMSSGRSGGRSEAFRPQGSMHRSLRWARPTDGLQHSGERSRDSECQVKRWGSPESEPAVVRELPLRSGCSFHRFRLIRCSCAAPCVSVVGGRVLTHLMIKPRWNDVQAILLEIRYLILSLIFSKIPAITHGPACMSGHRV